MIILLFTKTSLEMVYRIRIHLCFKIKNFKKIPPKKWLAYVQKYTKLILTIKIVILIHRLHVIVNKILNYVLKSCLLVTMAVNHSLINY